MSNLVVTAFDSAFLGAGLTQIAAIHRTSWFSVDRILVYDLGLTVPQREFLRRCEKVEVLSFPDVVNEFFPAYLEPRQFAWKPCAIKFAGQYGARVLWLDAGAMPLKDLRIVFDAVEEDEIFFVTDDHPNDALTLGRAFDRMRANEAERRANQIWAGCIGYKVGGRYQTLIEEAFEYSQDPEIVRGPHESHRHDQSIYSVLAVRHKCPQHPWQVFGEFRGPDRSPDQVIYVHRRKHHDTSGLRIRWDRELSVCLCVYQARATVGRVLESLAAQEAIDPERWEVVAVDNNSTDGTPDLVESLRPRLPCRLRLVREPNQGLLFARRRGTLESAGAVVLFLDDDMILDRRWARNCLDFFAGHPKAGLVGGVIRGELDGPTPPGWESVRWMCGVRDTLGPEDILLNDRADPLAHPYGGGTAVRTALAQEIYLSEQLFLAGREGPGLGSCEDIEFAWHALRRGAELWYTPRLESRHIIPAWRLDIGYLSRLRRAVAASCVAMDVLRDKGFYPPGRRHAAQLCWWAARAMLRDFPTWVRRDAASRLARAGMIGRLQGAIRVLADTIRKYGLMRPCRPASP